MLSRNFSIYKNIPHIRLFLHSALQCGRKEAEEMIFQLVKQMAKNEGDEAILTDKQLETLEKYDDAMNEK